MIEPADRKCLQCLYFFPAGVAGGGGVFSIDKDALRATRYGYRACRGIISYPELGFLEQ
jgi:hypothetical protein